MHSTIFDLAAANRTHILTRFSRMDKFSALHNDFRICYFGAQTGFNLKISLKFQTSKKKVEHTMSVITWCALRGEALVRLGLFLLYQRETDISIKQNWFTNVVLIWRPWKPDKVCDIHMWCLHCMFSSEANPNLASRYLLCCTRSSKQSYCNRQAQNGH